MKWICFVYYCIANTASSVAKTEKDVKLLDIKQQRKEILDSVVEICMRKLFETELAKLKSFFLTDRKFFVTFEHLNDDVSTVIEAAQNVVNDTKADRSLSKVKELTTKLDVIIETLMPVLDDDFDAITLFDEVVKFKLTNLYFLLEIYGMYDKCDAAIVQIKNRSSIDDKASSTQKALETCCDDLSCLFDIWTKKMQDSILLLLTKSTDLCNGLRTENIKLGNCRTPQQLYHDLREHIVSMRCIQECFGSFFGAFIGSSLDLFDANFLDELTTFMQNMVIYAKLDAQTFAKRVDRYVTACKNIGSVDLLQGTLTSIYRRLLDDVSLYQRTFKSSLYWYTKILNINIERSCAYETQKTDFVSEMKVIMFEYLKVFKRISENTYCFIPDYYKQDFGFDKHLDEWQE